MNEAAPKTTVQYHFGHRVLPSLGFQNPVGFLSTVAGPTGQQLLQEVWEHVRAHFGIETERATPEFPIEKFMIGEDCAVLIELPPPQRSAEPYFVVFATRLPESADSPPPPTPPRARYFTLEKGVAELAELAVLLPDDSGMLHAMTETVLGEWTAEGDHRNYGPGPKPDDWRAFASVLIQEFGGTTR